MQWQGVAASPGIGIGSAFIKQEQDIKTEERKITSSEVKKELQLLQDSIDKAEAELLQIKENLTGEESGVIEVQLMFLQDPELIPAIKDRIAEDNLAATSAVKMIIEEYAKKMVALDSDYMQLRAADIRDIGQRLIKHLQQTEGSGAVLPEKAIILARNLHPSETAEMDKEKVAAFVTEEGSHNSHTAIIARSLGIPAVVGVGTGLIERVKNGDLIIVDGTGGEVTVNPGAEKMDEYRDRRDEYRVAGARWAFYRDKPAKTIDGRRVKVFGNITGPGGVERVISSGGEGIGLFRTEFIFMNRSQPPSEEEQFTAYRKVVNAAGERPVIIRTLDIGGDKDLPYFNSQPEANPFLGCRGIRFSLQQLDIFQAQLKAILRAAFYGRIKVMFPLITSIAEVVEVKKQISKASEELDREGRKFETEIEIGIMIETPAAARMAEKLAEQVDFFSIGTNDLIQYLLAVDRTNELVSGLYSPYHPAVLRFIKDIIEAGIRQKITVGMCGEAAGNKYLIPFLLGAGLDEFSLNAEGILRQKGLISGWEMGEAEEVCEKVLSLSYAEEVRKYLHGIYRD